MATTKTVSRIIWNYSDLEDMTAPNLTDTAEVTVPLTDPIPQQLVQISQTEGAAG